MKRQFIIFSLLGLLVLSLGLQAQPPDMPRHRMMQRMLNLTDEQQSQMQEMMLKLQKELIPLRSQLQQLKGELKLAMTADKFDEAKVRKLVKDMEKIRSQIHLKKLLHKREVRNMLTPEQQVKFDIHMLSGKRHHGMGQPPMMPGMDMMPGAGHHGPRFMK